MRAICRLAGAIAALATMSSASRTYAQETKQLPVPNVTVTAPGAPVEPPYLRNPWKSYDRNPYAGRYRVEEDKFTEVPCNETRIASSAGGKCLQGYRLVPGNVVLHQSGGLRCDMALDVVMYKVGNLSIEASTLIFDPYKVVATGMPNASAKRRRLSPASARAAPWPASTTGLTASRRIDAARST